ncbi:MAG: hypothetical protein F4Y38_11520 [Gemmatimonadetes bacterium]|nr:hypothetical protein [Gemmatimonadota bacterium]MYG86280.1 hypothetical protein [Gemmatimonadota bacterium]MYJ91013.1 hypothetical protein [Gemmatimonadota bacterium]
MYRTLFWFLLPLVITELIYELGIQVINGGIARVPRPTETLAAYGIAWGLTSFLTGTVSQTRQMSMVLVRDRATFLTVFRCVAGFGGVHFLVLACLAFTPVGLWVIDELHAVDPALGGTVRRALGLLLPIPLIVGITRFLSGLLLRVRRTDIISYAMMAGISMSVVSVFLFLPTPTVQADPILLPVAATYFGVLTELVVIIYGYRRFARRSLRRGGSAEGELAAGQDVGQDTAREPVSWRQYPLTTGYVLRFYWPLAVTIGIQALSRPIINLFVARGADGTESLAVLTIVYALAHLPYGWLNELKNLPPAFQRQDPGGRIIRRFTAVCGLISFGTMVLMFWTPVRFFLLETLIGVDHDFAVRCTVPLIIFSFFPLAVTIRSYLHGIALRDHRTGAIAPSGPARAGAIVIVVNVLALFDLHGAIRGVAALYSGFVTETIVVRWRMGRRRG